MGLFGSKAKRNSKQASSVERKSLQTTHEELLQGVEDSGSADNGTSGADSSEIICQIAQKVSAIRVKAEETRSQLQEQVVELEQNAASSEKDESIRENGVVVTAYQPPEDTSGMLLLEAMEGEQLEVIVRDAGGWAYCRKHRAQQPGWLPSVRVAEIAMVIADHEDSGHEGMLNLKKGEMVEVVNRHYSGWAFCREWAGPPLPGCSDERKEGWVTDAYLEDKRSAATLASKWHRLVLQALDQVVSSSKELEVVLAQAQSAEWSQRLSSEWKDQCLEFAAWLTTELLSISEAMTQRQQSTSVSGRYATVGWDVVAGAPTELSVSKGDQVLVLDAENPDWAWCRSGDGSECQEGWVPLNVLVTDDARTTGESEEQRLTQKDLPEWVREGETCKWWSASGARWCGVSISKVDEQNQEVRVVFDVDTTCWKSLSFDHFAQPQEQWLLQPADEKCKELRSQLPDWLQQGARAYWWSASQQRSMAVTIREVCFKRKMVSVAFEIDKHVRKNLHFHELIDDPKKCLLQQRKEDHAWRGSAKQGNEADAQRNEALHHSKLSDPSAEVDSQTSAVPAVSPDAAFQQTAALKMDTLFEDMQRDVGDMLGPDAPVAGHPPMVEEGGINQSMDATSNEIQPPICSNGTALADPIETDGLLHDAVPPAPSPAISLGASASAFLLTPAEKAAGPHGHSGTMPVEHSMAKDAQLDEALKSLESFPTVPINADPPQSTAALHRKVVVAEGVEVIEEGGDMAMPAHVDSQLAALRDEPAFASHCDATTPPDIEFSKASAQDITEHGVVDEDNLATAEQLDDVLKDLQDLTCAPAPHGLTKAADAGTSSGPFKAAVTAVERPEMWQGGSSTGPPTTAAESPEIWQGSSSTGPPTTAAESPEMWQGSSSIGPPTTSNMGESSVVSKDAIRDLAASAEPPPLACDDSTAKEGETLRQSAQAPDDLDELALLKRLATADENVLSEEVRQPNHGGQSITAGSSPAHPQLQNKHESGVPASSIDGEGADVAIVPRARPPRALDPLGTVSDHQVQQLPKDAPQNSQVAQSPRPVAWGADGPKSRSALPPITVPRGQAEKAVVKWAEPCASSMSAKGNLPGDGGNLLDLDFTSSEQDLMDNLGDTLKETDAQGLSESNGFYSTAEKQLLAEIDVPSPHASPKDQWSAGQATASQTCSQKQREVQPTSGWVTAQNQDSPSSKIALQRIDVNARKDERERHRIDIRVDRGAFQDSLNDSGFDMSGAASRGNAYVDAFPDTPEAAFADVPHPLFNPKPVRNAFADSSGVLPADASHNLSHDSGFSDMVSRENNVSGPAPKEGWGTGSLLQCDHPQMSKSERVTSNDPHHQRRLQNGANVRGNAWGAADVVPESGHAFKPLAPEDADSGCVTLKEACRVLLPDAWDSDSGDANEPQPRLLRLATAWPELHLDFDSVAKKKETDLTVELAAEATEVEAAIDLKTDDLQQKLEQRARVAESKLDPASAQRMRSMAWGLVNKAEAAKELRLRGRNKRLVLRHQKAACEKESLRVAICHGMSGAVSALFVVSEATLVDLSTREALAETLEMTTTMFSMLQAATLRPVATAAVAAAPKAAVSARPAASQIYAEGGLPSHIIWEDCKAQHAHGCALEGASNMAVHALGGALHALRKRLTQVKEEIPAPDNALEVIAKNQHGLSKAEIRDKKMFEGQQEFNYQQSFEMKLKEQVTRWKQRRSAALARAERVLQRRLRRRVDQNRPHMLHELKAVADAIMDAESGLETVRQDYKQRATAEADQMEKERRGIQEQTQVMLGAAMVIREEKKRMADALNAYSSRERVKLMRVALRRVRRLNHDMKNLMVANDLKQKHSVLLYSLRMLEARLLTECPDAKHEMEEGPLEQTPEHHQQLYEARQNFEDELANDLADLHKSYSARADRAAARQAAEFRRSMQEELGEITSSAKGAMKAFEEASHLVALAKEILTPLADAEACLGAEAFRHAEVERGPQEASAFRPNRKYLEEAIDKTSLELEGLGKSLHTVVFSRDSHAVDRDWERAISRVEKRWTAFCEAYPDLHPEPMLGSETPRSITESDAIVEGHRSTRAAATLMFDDLDLAGENEGQADGPSPRLQSELLGAEQSPKGRSSKQPGSTRHESRGRKNDANDSPSKSVPKRPPGPPGMQRGARPPKAALDASAKSRSLGKGLAKANQPTSPSRGQQASGKDATALLERLDALTKTMDTTLSQAGAFSRPPANCPSKAPLPSRKPAIPPARKRGGAA